MFLIKKNIKQEINFKNNYSQNVKAIKHEIDDVTHISSATLYRPPKELRRRSEIVETEQKVYESNT